MEESAEPLDPEQARVLGSLIEKAFTTPDHYPLTLNALVAACNQRTNRDPVMDLDEATVDRAVRSLVERRLAGMTRASGGRVVKYVHRAGEALEVDEEQLSLLAVLLLRGPQTPGELRTRTDRYLEFPTTEALERRLDDLIHRDVPLVTRLERGPGQKEHRYAALLTRVDSPHPRAREEDLRERVEALEDRVASLERLLHGS